RTVELPPAGTLTGLVRRALKGTVTTPFAVKTPAHLEELA
ncbi:ACP S-malonyltransferase, partial [Klebsiella pneumoniae]